MNLEKPLEVAATGGARVMCTLSGGGDDVAVCDVVFCAVASDFCNYIRNMYSTNNTVIK
jgi:hypothetical protein